MIQLLQIFILSNILIITKRHLGLSTPPSSAKLKKFSRKKGKQSEEARRSVLSDPKIIFLRANPESHYEDILPANKIRSSVHQQLPI